MRFAVPCAVISLLLFACAIGETADEETFPLSESLDELDAADSRMSLSKDEYRKEDRKCIRLNEDCAHDKDNCCWAIFTQMKCKCLKDRKGVERCFCKPPSLYY
ncbi:U1-lycotoxin-Ls1n like protein [Argiope bruennichi]|uniref:U1-lycotoxin-Ls1n like protein n=1 Tax=Argiope bruennichi TaxID=94029 RepID=A0A8T0EGB1_ARGBR|nr:U1-lycotoxin-Ls1n like protein [Argiope bruennichi]